MNGNLKKLKKYLGASPVLKFFTFLFLGLVVFSSIFGISYVTDLKANVEKFWDNEEGKYAYLDIYGVSDWVASDDVTYFYSAIDDQGNYYVVAIDPKKCEEMYDQKQYWNEDVALPEPVRVYGYVYEVEDDLRQIYMDTYDLNEEDFEYFFGYLYLDTTEKSDDTTSIFISLAILGMLFGGLLFIEYSKVEKVKKKCLNELAVSGQLDKLLENFDYNDIKGQKVILAENFMLIRHQGVICEYKDVYWTFVRKQSVNFIPVGSNLIVAGKNFKEATVDAKAIFQKKDSMEMVMQFILSKNPNVMIGYSEENRKTYKEMIK